MVGREDASIAHAVSRAIAADPALSLHARINVTARDGIVTLEGTVHSAPEASRAVAAALRAAGVLEVVDRLHIESGSLDGPPTRRRPRRRARRGLAQHDAAEAGAARKSGREPEILREIQARIGATPGLESSRLLVLVDGARVILNGEVISPEQRLLARRLVWVPGVRIVVDAITVRSASGDRLVVQ